VKPEALDAVLARVRAVLDGLGVPAGELVRTPFLGDKGRNPEFVARLGPV
jgi:hypothetical protein